LECDTLCNAGIPIRDIHVRRSACDNHRFACSVLKEGLDHCLIADISTARRSYQNVALYLSGPASCEQENYPVNNQQQPRVGNDPPYPRFKAVKPTADAIHAMHLINLPLNSPAVRFIETAGRYCSAPLPISFLLPMLELESKAFERGRDSNLLLGGSGCSRV
jgi:hypothetical protein